MKTIARKQEHMVMHSEIRLSTLQTRKDNQGRWIELKPCLDRETLPN